jgi:DNA-binding transcriptional LysR family regulator
MGVAIAQVSLVSEDLATGRLVMPFETVVTEEDAFYIIYAEGAARNKTLQRFRDWLIKEAGTPLRRENGISAVSHAGSRRSVAGRPG